MHSLTGVLGVPIPGSGGDVEFFLLSHPEVWDMSPGWRWTRPPVAFGSILGVMWVFLVRLCLAPRSLTHIPREMQVGT